MTETNLADTTLHHLWAIYPLTERIRWSLGSDLIISACVLEWHWMAELGGLFIWGWRRKPEWRLPKHSEKSAIRLLLPCPECRVAANPEWLEKKKHAHDEYGCLRNCRMCEHETMPYRVSFWQWLDYGLGSCITFFPRWPMLSGWPWYIAETFRAARRAGQSIVVIG